MDHQNQPNPEEEDLRLTQRLTTPEQGEDILPDEQAMAAAGLTHPSELDIDRIIQETLAENWSAEEQEPPQMPPEQPLHDEEYRDVFGDGEELERIFSDEPMVPEMPPAAPEAPEKPVKKRRPQRKKGYGFLGLPHVLATLVWIAIVVVIGATLGRAIWLCASDVLAFGRGNQDVTITITESDTIETISKKLEAAGLVRYPQLFKLYADIFKADEKISPGTFTLNTVYDYHALVSGMQSDASGRQEVEVVIPEGYTCAQIFNLLEEKGVCSAADLEAWASDGELDDYWFLEGVERGSKYCLEGFLFPDTYRFYTNDQPRRVLEKFLNDFDYRFSEDMISDIDTLNQRLSQQMADNGYDETYIAEHQMTVREVTIVASLIERETASTLESYTIASVIYNRLTNAAEYPYLNIDAAVLYALGTHKTELTAEDLRVDSPYNTYTHTGLTPGAICNPGLYSLNAALDPDDTGYYYYAMDPDTGTHHFSQTADEHEAFLATLGGED